MDTGSAPVGQHGETHFFEHEQYIGKMAAYFCGISTEGGRSSGWWPHTAFLCPECGDLWGRAINIHGPGYAPRVTWNWTFLARHCPKHGDGTFLQDADLRFCDPGLLKREALLLLFKQP